MTDTPRHPSLEDLTAWQQALAPQAFNRAWELLDADTLTREQEEELMAAAFAQRHHWYAVGDARNWAIADWQVSRAAAVLGYADLAARFGERSLEVAVEHGLDPFVVGFAHEAIARAAAEVDDIETFTDHLELAKATLAEIDDPEERETLEADLAEMSER